MKKKFWIRLTLLLIIPGMLFTVSCSKKAVKPDDAGQSEQERQDELARQRAIEEEELNAAKRQEMTARQQFTSEDVYFEFDSAALTFEARDVLKRKTEWLRTNPDGNILIEGHCDERGTTEYNLALGDQRAQSAKRFIINLGISPARLSTVSYGEEKPLDPGNSEEAWAKNRRAHFVIR